MFYRSLIASLLLAGASPINTSLAADQATSSANAISLESSGKAVEINRLAVTLRLSQKKLTSDKESGAPQDVLDADLSALQAAESAFNKAAGLK